MSNFITKNNKYPPKHCIFESLKTTLPKTYMHDHTKQQLELFDKKFVKHIDDHTEPVFIDAVGSVGPIRQFIQQALKSQAEMIRAEMDSTIGSLNGLGGCECCISKVNKQKANLDELINSFE